MGDGGPPKPGLTDKLQSYAIAGETFTIPEYYGELSGPMGSGAYGVVCAAVNKRTGEKVAVKKIRGAFNNTEDAKRTLREARLLRHFKHDNVISFKDILPPSPDLTFASIYVIMELMDTDLFTIIRSGQTLEDDHILYFMYQILCGVQYIHSFDVVHRDLKPANLLVNKDCCLKICDFGMARGIGPAHHNSKMTEYVVTRWYRAPEVLLRSCGYTKALDVWSVGCIFAELLLRQPLFPGKNHAHQMHIILDVLGAPTEMGWKNVCEGRTWECFKDKPREPKRPLSSFLTKASPTALDLVKKLLSFDPSQRISIAEALQHGYLQDVFRASSDLSQPSGLIPVLAWEDNLFKLSMESPPIQKWRLKELMYNEVRCYHKEMPTWEEAVHQAKETTDVRGAVDLKRSRPSNSSSSAPIPFAPFPDKTAPWAEHQKKVQQQQQFIAQQQQQKQLIAQQLQQNQMQRGGGGQPAPQGGVVQQQLLQGQQQQQQQLLQQLQGQCIPPQPQQQPLSGQYPPQAGQIPQQQPRASQQFAAPQPPTAHKQAMLQPSAARPMSNGGFVAPAPASNGSSMSLASPATMSTAPSDIASFGSFEFAGSDLELIDKNVSFDALAAFDVSTPLPEGSRDAKKAKLTPE